MICTCTILLRTKKLKKILIVQDEFCKIISIERIELCFVNV